MEAGEAVVEDLHASGIREAEEIAVGINGTEDAALIPAGAVVFGAAVQEIGVFHKVMRQVVEVVLDDAAREGQGFADLEA